VNYDALKYVNEECRVKGAGRALLHAIAYRAHPDTGECFAAERKLAHAAGVAKSTAEAWLTKLVDLGELAVVLDGSGRRSTCYRIVAHLDPSDSTTESLDASGPTTGAQASAPATGARESDREAVVPRSATRSAPIREAVVPRSAGAYIAGREELEGLKGGGAAAAPSPNGDGGAARASTTTLEGLTVDLDTGEVLDHPNGGQEQDTALDPELEAKVGHLPKYKQARAALNFLHNPEQESRAKARELSEHRGGAE
jgi:hypothetical protein